MHAKPLLILKTGTTFPSLAKRQGDFDDWVKRSIEPGIFDVEVSVAYRDPLPPAPELYCGAVITGSHAMVTDREPWSEALASWLAGAVRQGLPLLGICYGHQLLAHALGGTVAYREQGIEVGTVKISPTAEAEQDPIFYGLPESFPAQTVHRQSVITLPPRTVVLAGNGNDTHHAFRHGHQAWGVQFHPEYDVHVMRGYIEHMAPDLEREGLDPQALLSAVRPTPVASEILRRFAAFCHRR